MGMRAEKIVSMLLFGLALSGCASTDLSVQSIPTTPLLSGPLQAQTAAHASPMSTSKELAATPAGFIGFCVRRPDQCQIPAAAPDTLALTPQLWSALNSVNQNVNGAIWPEDDMHHYGRAEFWTIPTDGYGDCEDYALTKRANLLAMSYSPRALRMAVVITPDGSRHAVLDVVTDQGDYVLDNLRNEVVGWQATAYRWLERQNPDQSLAWVSVDSDEPLLAQSSAGGLELPTSRTTPTH
jgi:predicted transglutaminase-like cysteine proteinase